MSLSLAPGLKLPLEAATQTFAILGKRGSGKTNTSVVITEEMLTAGIHVVVLDPLDVWYGLRSSPDGNSPRFPITVLGGNHGDLPLEATAGAVIADFVVENQAPIILSLRHFSGGEQRRFVTDFCERLFHRKGEADHQQPLHVVIDEADEFCLSEDTELLSRSGWIKQEDIREGMEASCFDLESGTYHWLPVERVIRRHHEGEMVSLRGRGIDCLATLDHRVVLQRTQRAPGRYTGIPYPWVFVDAMKVPQHIHVPAGGAPVGPGIPGLSPHILRIIGWVVTDGFIHQKTKNRNLGLQQSHSTEKLGERIVETMDTVLKAAG